MRDAPCTSNSSDIRPANGHELSQVGDVLLSFLACLDIRAEILQMFFLGGHIGSGNSLILEETLTWAAPSPHLCLWPMVG